MGRKRKSEKSKKRLGYGIIAVVFIFACLLTYFALHSSPPEVAIIDHLSFYAQQRNQTFVDTCISILEEGGLSWNYYEGKEVTVNFYRKLPSYGTGLIILRVHSAMVEGKAVLGLFTSELYSDHKATTTYREDVLHQRLVRAFFTEGGDEYFGIVPKFVEESMEGKFEDTIVIMMGCEGLNYTGMAEAFVKRGAKVYVSWSGPVSIEHTDLATVRLLQSLIIKKRTIKEAVEQTNYDVGPDPMYNSTLKYHPNSTEVGNYTIPNLKGSLPVNVAYSAPVQRTPARSKCTAH
jgi:hypothetical protein